MSAPLALEHARQEAIAVRYILKDLGSSWQLWLYEDEWIDVGRFYRLIDVEDLLMTKVAPLRRP